MKRLHRKFPKPKIDDPDVYVRFANNVFGKKVRSCHIGSFNLSKDEDENLWLHIYIGNKEVIKLIMYKNPYQLAEAILKHYKPYEVIDEIKRLQKLGYREGRDFTITKKGVYLRSHIKDRSGSDFK